MSGDRPPLVPRSDVWSGALLAVVALAVWFGAARLPTGSLRAMGPGFFPAVLAVFIGVIGLVLIVKGLVAPGAPMARWRPMPGLLVAASVGMFGVLVERAGLPIAVIACGIIAGLAGDDRRPLELALYVTGAALVSVVLFVRILGVPIPVLPWLS